MSGASLEQAGGWSVYLLECSDGSLYCGVTTDIPRRIAMHNGELPGGAKYTRGRRPVRLAASAGALCRDEALRLEARIKRLPKREKLMMLQNYAGTVQEEAPAQACPHKA